MFRHTDDGSDNTANIFNNWNKMYENINEMKVDHWKKQKNFCAILTDFTSRAMSSFWTDAFKFANAVDASSSTETRLWWTFIYIDSTIWSRETLSTSTSKPTISRFTCSSIKTWLTLALINCFCAKCTAKSICAYTNRCSFTSNYDLSTSSAICTLTTITLRNSFSARFT